MIVRGLLFLLPLALWAYVFINQRVARKEITGSFMGFVWAFHVVLLLNVIFINKGFWSPSIQENMFYGVPLDWVFSQAVILGAIIPLGRLLSISAIVRHLAQIGMIIVIYYSAGLALNDLNAFIIVTSVYVSCATLAMALSDWTANDTHIRARSLLQAIAWALLLLWLFPSTVLYLTVDSWSAVLQRDLATTVLYLLPLLIPGFLLVSALVQFAIEGNGTAFPYDPPKRLVTGGVYQYLSNPMQVGICLMMCWWGVFIQSIWISISSFVAVILFIVFKDVCNGSCAIGKGNKEWEAYQQAVPKWIPRLKTRLEN